MAEKLAEPLHWAAFVWIFPLTLLPENLPETTCTIGGAPGPGAKRSATDALKVPDEDIRAGLVLWTFRSLSVLQ